MKNLFAKIIFASILSYCTVTMAEASNDCYNFHIQISNLTKDACFLIEQNVRHGNLITPAPSSILPNDSQRFDMSQSIYGPAILLSYQCGQETITFSSRQNLCVLAAGDIQGEVLEPLPLKITANYTAITGSHFWKRSGSINWSITTLTNQTGSQ